jgi:hypothetical protein
MGCFHPPFIFPSYHTPTNPHKNGFPHARHPVLSFGIVGVLNESTLKVVFMA